jgi:methionyl-tRNA formyltransferase
MIKILLLCGDNNRAKSYASILKKSSKYSVTGLLYGITKDVNKLTSKIIIDTDTKDYLDSINVNVPSLDKDIESLFIDNNWQYIITKEREVNSEEIRTKIKNIDCDYVVFAGYGGQILSKEHFLQGKKYIHCHPGWLPLERGSTTLYYSLLNERDLSVTSFFMTEKIDEGNMLLRESYKAPKKLINIDVWVDNALRADTLFKSIELLSEKFIGFSRKEEEEDQEYYVIHPLLKHIAILGLTESK